MIVGYSRASSIIFPPYTTGLFIWNPFNYLSGGNGDSVPQVIDFSGNNNHSDTMGASVQGTVVAGAQNGLKVLNFNNLTDGSVQTGYTYPNIFGSLTAATIFIVFKRAADPPAGAISSGLWSYGTHGGSDHWPNAGGDTSVYDGWGSTVRKTLGTPAGNPIFASTYRRVSVWTAANDYGATIDDAAFFSTVTNTVGFKTGAGANSCTLGVNINSAVGLLGNMAEVLIYDHKVSAGNSTIVDNYLVSKWGL